MRPRRRTRTRTAPARGSGADALDGQARFPTNDSRLGRAPSVATSSRSGRPTWGASAINGLYGQTPTDVDLATSIGAMSEFVHLHTHSSHRVRDSLVRPHDRFASAVSDAPSALAPS